MSLKKKNQVGESRRGNRAPLLDLDDGNTPAELGNSRLNNSGTELPLINEDDLAAMIKRAEITPLPQADRRFTIDTKAGPPLEEHAQEELNKPKKMIEFDKHLTALKNRTESEVPYCMTQCEDAMYLDQFQVVTLEFHYYQNGCSYHNLIEVERRDQPDGSITDTTGKKIYDKLGLQNYKDENVSDQSHFKRADAQILIDNGIDILRKEKYGRDREFSLCGERENVAQDDTQAIQAHLRRTTMNMYQEKKDKKKIQQTDEQLIEGYVVLYKVTAKGGMQQRNQVPIKMGRKWLPSKDGNMQLTRSRDKRRISLVNFDRENTKGDYFKFMSWSTKLKPDDIRDSLNKGLSDYYKSVKSTFHQLVEICYVDQCKHIMMVYIESVERSLEEQQEYELAMTKFNEEDDVNASTMSQRAIDLRTTHMTKMRESQRKGRKYVFFDVETGEVKFEYGGVHPPMQVTNVNQETTLIYQMGLRIKEIRETQFDSKLYFFMCGDLWEEHIKKQQVINNWCFLNIEMDLSDLFELESQEIMHQFIAEKIQDNIPGGKEQNRDNFFIFDKTWITSDYFNWENNITLSNNRNFSQIALINQPSCGAIGNVKPCYYLNGNKFKKTSQDGQELLDIPFQKYFKENCIIRHSRNSLIKNEMFFDVIENGVTNTTCLRQDKALAGQRIKQFLIPLDNYLSRHDVWLQAKKNFSDKKVVDVAQVIHVHKGDQYAQLTTRIPVNFIGSIASEYKVVTRKSSQYQQQCADHPVLAYNIGQQKIFVQNTLKVKANETLILNIPSNERFLSFVEFNKFLDIGIYTEHLNVECCAHVAYMTTGIESNSNDQNRLYLLLIDPLYPDVHCLLFRSQSVFDNEVMDGFDTILRTVAQCTASRIDDNNFEVYLWSQLANDLKRSKLLRIDKHTHLHDADSDVEMEEQEFIDKEKVEDCFDLTKDFTMEQVNMCLDGKGFIYYLTCTNNIITIMEGNPRNPYKNKHYPICKIKTPKVLSFGIEGTNHFFIMDQNHNIYKFYRNDNNRKLHLMAQLHIKEIQRLDYSPEDFSVSILSDKYAIYKELIFYFFEHTSFPPGVFEAEKLIELNPDQARKVWLKGPYRFSGSNRFYNVLRQNKFKTFIRIFNLPDKTQRTLVNDFSNMVDMSTFLTGGQVLLRCRRRFMIFSNTGNYIDEVQFNNEGLKDKKGEEDSDSDVPKPNHAIKVINLNLIDPKTKPKKFEVLDFHGGQYILPQPPQRNVEISNLNKMELLQFSQNNEYFLFYNRMTEQFLMYEIGFSAPVEQKSFFDLQEIIAANNTLQTDKWQFKFKYEICLEDSFMYKYLTPKDIDVSKYFRNNTTLFKVQRNGGLKLNYCDSIQMVEGDDNERLIQYKLIGTQFIQDGNSPKSKCIEYNHIMEFPLQAKLNLLKIDEDKKTNIERKLENIRIIQTRYPKNLHDYTEYNTLIRELREIENKKEIEIYAKCYFENIVVVYQGNMLKYGWIQPNSHPKQIKDSHRFDLEIMKEQKSLLDVGFTFTEDTEIIQLIETNDHDVIQILANRYSKGIIIVVTWDFKNNIEKSMFQIQPDASDYVGNHIVKGMNYKMNYYIDQHMLVDLEYNIPIRQENVNQNLDPSVVDYHKQLKTINHFYNQRKLNDDNKIFLGIEKAHCLYFDLSRMDITLWKNISEQGEQKNMIKQSVSINNFNLSFDSCSLFHYFASNSEAIQVIYDLYNQEKSYRELSNSEKNLPLQILNPDQYGKSALYTAVANQSISSFELMVQLLKGFNDICITKMMLKSLALIFQSDQDSMIDFFDQCWFVPPQMAIEQFVPWEDDLDMIVFPSHTSIISQEFLFQKLSEHGIEVDFESLKSGKGLSDKDGEKQKAFEKDHFKTFKLDAEFDTGLPKGQIPLRKVKIQALDMDWLFENDNAKTLLNILASDESNPCVLTMQTMQVFLNMTWDKYQPAIIKYVFFPYMIYLILMCRLVCQSARQYIDSIAAIPTEEIDTLKHGMTTEIIVLVPFAVILMLFFLYLELPQIIENGPHYLSDIWNIIDMSIVYLNMVFLIMICGDVIRAQVYFPLQIIQVVGSFAVFFMWLKVFYWCRIFQSLAYYVKLIIQTLADSAPFMLMCLIICIAFGVFFVGVDQDLQSADNNHIYMAKFFGEMYIDSVVDVYIIGALGNLDDGRFRRGAGPLQKPTMVMFLASTFIIAVVFMNMLIAIMSNTYTEVQDGAVENGIKERVNLMDDHLWLLDLQKVFKNEKYVLIVSPSNDFNDTPDPTIQRIADSEVAIKRQMSNLERKITDQITTVHSDVLYDISQQFIGLGTMMDRLRDINTMVESQQPEQEQIGDTAVKMSAADLKRKKKEFAEAINLGDTSQMTPEKIAEHAINWMLIVDKNGDGNINLPEFFEFFYTMDGIFMSDNEIEQMFEEFDADKTGELSVEEFARAITHAIVPDEPDDDVGELSGEGEGDDQIHQ